MRRYRSTRDCYRRVACEASKNTEETTESPGCALGGQCVGGAEYDVQHGADDPATTGRAHAHPYDGEANELAKCHGEAHDDAADVYGHAGTNSYPFTPNRHG